MSVYLKNVTTLKLDTETCIGCGICTAVCPHAVFEIREGKAVLLDRDRCIECGACARNCPVNALSVRAGVGCATGLINAALGIDGDCCGSAGCCAPEDTRETDS
jgi:NAD-dependent dihydropyrimidine dehydrogenase PreA subunit